jgi:hypothetical protein
LCRLEHNASWQWVRSGQIDDSDSSRGDHRAGIHPSADPVEDRGMTDTLLPPAVVPLVVRERTLGNRTTILDLSFDGSEPPMELLAELRRLGWEGAVAPSPRADVIDWGRPDPARGTGYSVRPHPVAISASLQARDAATCQAIRRATDELLARHRAPAAAPSAASALADVTCAASHAASVEAALAALGEVVERGRASEVVVLRFRGNTTESIVQLARFRVAVAPSDLEGLAGRLSAVGVRSVTPVR